MQLFASLMWPTAIYLSGCLFTLFLTIVYVLSQLHLLAIKLFCTLFGKSFDPMEGPDVAFQHNGKSSFGDPSCATLVIAVLILKGRLDLEAFRQRVWDRIITVRKPGTRVKEFPRWTQRFVKRHGFLVWEEVQDFSIERQVTAIDVGYTDDASLIKVLMTMVNKPLPADRPPWDIIMVPKLREDKEGTKVDTYATVFRFSHSFMDGMKFMQVCSFLVDKDPQRSYRDLQESFHLMPYQLPPIVKQHALLRFWADPEQSFNLTSLKDLILNAGYTLAYFPWNFGWNILFREKNGLNGPVISGRKLVAMSEPLDFRWMKDVSKAFGCTVSDVFYSCIVASFRQCDPSLSAHVRMFIALSVLKSCKSCSENTLSVCSANLPTIHVNPVERLKCISQKYQTAKKSAETICNLIGFKMYKQWFLPNKISRELLRCSIVATNLNGPPFEIFIGGDAIVDMFYLAPNGYICGITISLMSYNGSVRVLVNVDRALALDDGIAQKLITCFVEELKQLHAAIDGNH